MDNNRDQETRSLMSAEERALRDLWRDAAEKGIAHGIDYRRIVLSLFRDLDEAAEFQATFLGNNSFNRLERRIYLYLYSMSALGIIVIISAIILGLITK